MAQRPTLTGTRIRERRLALSQRQADLARAAGISPAYLNLIEHNRRPAGDALVARLAALLDVPAAELESGREEARIAALREAAAHLAAPDPAPETDQAARFLARFPGWAGALIGTARRAEALEARLVDLSDRMTQDPYLLDTLHEVLSAVTSLRSAASILAEGGDLPPEWTARFHANLDEDSQRLSTTAQALVAYLDGFETQRAALTPRDELAAWLAAGAPPLEQAADLASDAARAMAQAHLDQLAAEATRLPDAALRAATEAAPQTGADALSIAAQLHQPPDLVMRRLAALRPGPYAQAGLMICDGAGGVTLRRPCPGFPQPRPGDACALWPLFQALGQPQIALRVVVETPEGARFDTLSLATRQQPLGTDGPVLTQAQMLILPGDAPGQTAARRAPVAIGPACRICPRPACPARREPSILSAG